jgi:hypothetical protein
MPRVGFEPTIPVFERAKTVHALDRSATVVGGFCTYKYINMINVVGYDCDSINYEFQANISKGINLC